MKGPAKERKAESPGMISDPLQSDLPEYGKAGTHLGIDIVIP